MDQKLYAETLAHLQSEEMQAYMKNAKLLAQAEFTDTGRDTLECLESLKLKSNAEKYQLRKTAERLFDGHIENA